LELLGSCMNFENHREEAVSQLCNLVKLLPTSRLYYSNGKDAAELVDRAHKNRYRV
jgi:hypothetical protein